MISKFLFQNQAHSKRCVLSPAVVVSQDPATGEIKCIPEAMYKASKEAAAKNPAATKNTSAAKNPSAAKNSSATTPSAGTGTLTCGSDPVTGEIRCVPDSQPSAQKKGVSSTTA